MLTEAYKQAIDEVDAAIEHSQRTDEVVQLDDREEIHECLKKVAWHDERKDGFQHYWGEYDDWHIKVYLCEVAR